MNVDLLTPTPIRFNQNYTKDIEIHNHVDTR